MNDERAKYDWQTLQAVKGRARELRQEQTPAEARLWEYLRQHHINGYKFRR